MVHDFKDSLAKGQRGETLFLELYPSLERLDGRKSDFRFRDTGKTVELKTDSYDMAKTENFFIEEWSDRDNKKPGGPWQAIKNGTTYFAYMFIQQKTVFWFNTEQLVRRMDLLKKLNPERIPIFNKGWVTIGIKIPRELLMDLSITKGFTNENK